MQDKHISEKHFLEYENAFISLVNKWKIRENLEFSSAKIYGHKYLL